MGYVWSWISCSAASACTQLHATMSELILLQEVTQEGDRVSEVSHTVQQCGRG